MNAPETIGQLLLQRVERSAGPALLFRTSDACQSWTWEQVLVAALRTAAALRRLGVEPGDRVAHWSANSPQWVTTDLALHLLGAVHVPIHATLSASQAAQQSEHCGAKAMIAADTNQAFQLRDCRRPAHCLLQGPLLDDPAPDGWRRLDLLRAEVNDAEMELVRREAPAQAAGTSLATILYTSGTTGEPKGVMLRQANLVFCACSMDQMFGSSDDSRRMCLLPLSHIFARTCDLYVWLAGRGDLVLAASRESLTDDCRRTDPTTLNGVPYLFQRLQQWVQGGQPLSHLLGQRIQYCCSGGAPLPTETYDFFQQHGVPLLQGYGLTETSPVISAATRGSDRRGAVGRPVPGVSVRIVDGEVQTCGPHVMSGYYRNPQATAAAISEDGWLSTGDLGRLDEDGFLYITGRRKELIILSSGKNISPTVIESRLTSDPLIDQAMVTGEGRSHLTALIVVEQAAAANACQRHDSLEQAVQAVVDTRLADLSHHEQVRRCHVLPRALSIDEGELTPKLSLRRERIAENWREAIESLYRAD